MRSLILARSLLARIFRRRAVWVTLAVLPLSIALSRAIFAGSAVAVACVWSCPLACALATWSAIGMQQSVDRMSGLEDALISSPLGRRGTLAARATAGAVIYAAQMSLLGTVLALRF